MEWYFTIKLISATAIWSHEIIAHRNILLESLILNWPQADTARLWWISVFVNSSLLYIENRQNNVFTFPLLQVSRSATVYSVPVSWSNPPGFRNEHLYFALYRSTSVPIDLVRYFQLITFIVGEARQNKEQRILLTQCLLYLFNY